MATYREQLDVIEGLSIKEGESSRINCPFCGGNRTFSVSRRNGALLWNCYKASCSISGATDTEMSSDVIQRRLSGVETATLRRTAPVPQHTTNVRTFKPALDYLRRVNSLEAHEQGLIRLRYAPAENRVLFYMPGGEGAVGRSLDGRKPKWKVFGETEGLMTIGKGPVAVVVEDAASAASVARVPECSGCALLGTHATHLQMAQLRAFQRVIIALDEDASQKAVRLKGKLEGRVETKVVFLEEDLKYATSNEVRRTLEL